MPYLVAMALIGVLWFAVLVAAPWELATRLAVYLGAGFLIAGLAYLIDR